MQLFNHPVHYETFMTHRLIPFSIFEHAKEATYLGFVRLKGKRKIGKIKLNERNIFLSRDSCSCRAKRLPTGDSFEKL